MEYDKYRVEFEDQVTYLNHKMVERQGVSDATLELIKQSHVERFKLFKTALATDDVTTLRSLAAQFEELEFRQQELWGFGRNADYHRWFDFPKCTCPKLDNMDRMGTSYRVYSEDCPIHSGKQP
jgi:hypothetical protein